MERIEILVKDIDHNTVHSMIVFTSSTVTDLYRLILDRIIIHFPLDIRIGVGKDVYQRSDRRLGTFLWQGAMVRFTRYDTLVHARI